MRTSRTNSKLGQRVIRAALELREDVPSDTGDGWQIDVSKVAAMVGCTVEEADAILQDVFAEDLR